MSAANDLFETLRAMRASPNAGKTSGDSVVDYCQNVLGPLERVHFDFKEKGHGSGLEESDKRNLAKAVSGFANGGGGVLIWGMKDETIEPRPVHGVAGFVDSLLQMSHQVTSPAVPGLDGDFVPTDGTSDTGFGLIYVPESELPPHRVVLAVPKVQNHYYIRSGSSFTVATHSQLEDMFGRRPRPCLEVVHGYEACRQSDAEYELWITVSLWNSGRGIAKYPFLDVQVDPPHGVSRYGVDGNGNHGLPALARKTGDVWDSMRFGSRDGNVIHSGVTLPVTRVSATVYMTGDRNTQALRVGYAVAAEGQQLRNEELSMSREELVEKVQALSTPP